MFPFNLPGPQFLVFYLIFGLVVLIACWVATRMSGGATARSITELTSDPYQIAYLRSGRKEMIRVATFNLVDRGFLSFDGTTVQANGKLDPAGLRRPIDRILVSQCKQPITPFALLDNTALRVECDKYQADLERRGLLPDAQARRGHRKLLSIAVGLLAGVAIVKLAVALSAGRTNVAVLVIFAVVLSLFAVKACWPRVSPTGRATMSGLRTLLKRLQGNASRLRPGGSTNEALLLAAVAGLAALPASEFAMARQMYPAQAGGSGDSGSGSSCSSDSSSGCGGGGGCGGCGG